MVTILTLKGKKNQSIQIVKEIGVPGNKYGLTMTPNKNLIQWVNAFESGIGKESSNGIVHVLL